jgi:hypothetical protein
MSFSLPAGLMIVTDAVLLSYVYKLVQRTDAMQRFTAPECLSRLSRIRTQNS